MKRSWIGLALVAVLAISNGWSEDEVSPEHTKNLEFVREAEKTRREEYKGNADYMVLPGLLADRRNKRVTVHAETTRLVQDDIVEFFLVDQASSHDYEALAVSFAAPGDIHKALEFIGLKPGRSIDPEKLQFWPKGERVLVTARRVPAQEKKPAIRIEQCVQDVRTGKPCPETGFVFTGSRKINSLTEPGKLEYAADVRDPRSIISDYNEPETVLDTPSSSPQPEVYQNLRVGRGFNFPSNSLVELVLEPEYKDGRLRVEELLLTVSPRDNDAPATLNNVVFSMAAQEGKEIRKNGTLKDVLEYVSGLVDSGRDPFVSLEFDGKLTLGVLHDVCRILSSIDTEKGMRIESPRPRHLYYKAYVPSTSYLDRQNRVAQPWELILLPAEGKVSGTLTKIDQVWKEGHVRPDLKTSAFALGSPEELQKTLSKEGPGLPVILVFAHPTVTHDQLMTWIAPVLPSCPTVHVFMDEKPVPFRAGTTPPPVPAP